MVPVLCKVLDERLYEWGLPKYATPESAAMDLRACIDGPLKIYPGERRLIPTGIAIDINNSAFGMFLLPKSGLGHKKGVILGNGTGLIDSDYQQQVMVSCWNSNPEGSSPFELNPGDFIAQAVLMPIVRFRLELVEDFNREVERKGGFGSTGDR